MREKSHMKTDSNSQSYRKVKYSSQRSTKVFFAKPAADCTKGDEPQEVITWKSTRSRIDIHDSKALFKINLNKIEDEENIQKMNNLLRGKRDTQIITKNIEL